MFKRKKNGQEAGEGNQCKLEEVAAARGLTGPHQRWRFDPQSERNLDVFAKALREWGWSERKPGPQSEIGAPWTRC
jgi:hypothetical protein